MKTLKQGTILAALGAALLLPGGAQAQGQEGWREAGKPPASTGRAACGSPS